MTLSDAGAALAPPDVASAPTTDLPAAWHRTLVTAAKRIVNREARRLNFAARAGVADVTRRLNGYAWKLWGPASPDYDTLWQIAAYAIDELSREGYQPSLAGFCEAQRTKSDLGVRAKAARVKDRNEGILQARATVQPVKAVAAQFEVSEATVKRVATPLAVAAWRKHQVSEPFSPPLPDDSKSEPNLFESSLSVLEKGSDTIVDCWQRNVGTFPTRRQQLQLITWYEAGQDNLTLVDLVRLIGYARGKRDPWAYVSAAWPGWPVSQSGGRTSAGARVTSSDSMRRAPSTRVPTCPCASATKARRRHPVCMANATTGSTATTNSTADVPPGR